MMHVGFTKATHISTLDATISIPSQNALADG